MSKEKFFNLFAYGTLLPGEEAYTRWCAPFVLSHCPAFVYGTMKRTLDGYPALCVYGGSKIRGEILTLQKNPGLETALDEWEDLSSSTACNSTYCKVRLSVFTATGMLPAFCYVSSGGYHAFD